ncbi:kinesin-like nuclear fusion protein [Mortierella polycephala]|uniref:Kinesin-like protein n=1 Tax=Mortierella polycephala TaxID=41804 RepID=A0A9P6PNL1_9FUNG|nr:kinesin-like nuclear fusion protein [Mortierella polycephala]
MEQLKRSISKLKPPTKITSSATTSSTIATALAVAAEYGANADENNASAMGHNNNNNYRASTMSTAAAPSVSTTVAATKAGLKRNAEEHNVAINKRARNAPVITSKTTLAMTRNNQLTRDKRPMGQVANATASSQAKVRATATPLRAPLSRVGQRGAATTVAATATRASSTTTLRRPITATTPAPAPAATRARPSTAATTTAVSTRGRFVAVAPTNRTRPQTRTQQPSPAPSTTSSSSMDSKQPSAEAAKIIAAIPQKKKRPAWDTKGRLEDMEELMNSLLQLLQTSSADTNDLTNKLEFSESKKSARHRLENKAVFKETENKTLLQKMQHVEQDLHMIARKHADEVRSLKSQHSLAMEQLGAMQSRLKQETETLETKLRTTNNQLEHQSQENSSLRSTISTQSANCLALESDNQALKKKIERTENTLAQRDATIETLEQQLSESQTLVQELEQRIRQEETIRRRLHNTIQELKGNIRVFCRVRPVTTSKNAPRAETTTASMKYPDQEGRGIEFAHSTESATGSQIEKAYPFTFDKVFQPTSTQEDVFEEISQLVQSALDGYNVCIFAYGQTGSGKTHTMEGPLNASAETMGMIPRSVLQIYENAKALESKGWTYTMEGQYVEIYNESINDLLGSDGLDGMSKKHEIRHGPNGKTTITDITTVVLTSPKKVAALLKKAAHNRSVGSTQMNERSSRSHCVFTLRLSGKNSITEESSEGVLNLIDLAGSERLSQSGATGDRLRETQAINKSLSCLGDVIYAISNKDPHIPYRNSKLTYLLQNSLGGNSKTLMFVNISPLMSNFSETLCSLRFATKVNSCTIGTATKRAVRA